MVGDGTTYFWSRLDGIAGHDISQSNPSPATAHVAAAGVCVWEGVGEIGSDGGGKKVERSMGEQETEEGKGAREGVGEKERERERESQEYIITYPTLPFTGFSSTSCVS